MTARFILSLDCEGKWGVTHHLRQWEQRRLSNQSLRRAYDSILSLLDEFDIAATFAFVGLFGETAASFRRLRPLVESVSGAGKQLLLPALNDMDHGSGEGWHGDWAVNAAGGARPGHEIAFQGSTHVPWDLMDEGQLLDEIQIYRALEGPVGKSRTMVYPRNRVAFTHILPSMGIEAFRTARPRSRALSLASEFNIFARPESDPVGEPGGPVAIPAGYFVNWRHGLRRLVPPAVSLRRFSSLLDHAERTGRVVHYWLHPENIASEPATLGTLRDMIKRVASARLSGKCRVLTQWDYCQEARAALPTGPKR